VAHRKEEVAARPVAPGGEAVLANVRVHLPHHGEVHVPVEAAAGGERELQPQVPPPPRRGREARAVRCGEHLGRAERGPAHQRRNKKKPKPRWIQVLHLISTVGESSASTRRRRPPKKWKSRF